MSNACPVCGNEECGQGGYLSCECPAPIDPVLAALKAAERAIDDCQTYRSHLHHKELAQVRAAIASYTAAPVELDALRRERDVWKDNAVQARSVIAMIRAMVGEMFGPVASIESEDATLLRGPEAKHDGEAVLEALQRVSSTLTRVTAERDEAVRLLGDAPDEVDFYTFGKFEEDRFVRALRNWWTRATPSGARLSRKDTDNG